MRRTVRSVPPSVDALLCRKATEAGPSFIELLRRALIKEAGLGGGEALLHDDLDRLAGEWVEDPKFDAFDAAVAAQDVIDESLWQ